MVEWVQQSEGYLAIRRIIFNIDITVLGCVLYYSGRCCIGDVPYSCWNYIFYRQFYYGYSLRNVL